MPTKCPVCGATKLVWGIFWADNNTDSGYFSCKGSTVDGSQDGRIFCKKCNASFSCILGKTLNDSSKATLTRFDSTPIKVSEKDAYSLKGGTYSI